MKSLITILAVGLTLAGAATANTQHANSPAATGGVRVETDTGVDFLRQYPDGQATVVFTGPANCRRVAGGNTVCRMQFNGLPGQWVVVHVSPIPRTSG